ncbi:Sodium:solute symporter family-domain-containing protein [Protomyces lactucae-debilis]|uniref:Sodium:solute symporter family-domain-containing protein n=1 Tax=Protomyces lactucae-debilis TaxID=2754530 RepID=A0A1Y2F922_PROLT|nr:Sodium:solute symporter family-domain-containing protein [Protomyces lactucae-debilis]ORY79944.1 Sodium:solute symporter family-domain-containing protein [Protomyces lactucae-debilis]
MHGYADAEGHISAFRDILPHWSGYALILLFALAATLLFLATSYIQRRYAFVDHESSEFTSASRSVKSFLISSSLVSSWTWSTTLVQACSSAYKWGIAGAFWSSSGATVQMIFFGFIAVKVKQCSPRCATILEIVHKRYGPSVHCLLMAYALVVNLAASMVLPMASSRAAQALSKTNIYLANTVTVMSVALYTLVGGLRATMIADYTHNVVVILVTLLFFVVTFVTSDKIGSPDRLYDLLKKAALTMPSEDGGTYLTFHSGDALAFGALSFIASFGMLFNDQVYWQRAIAARPRNALRGYIFGGLAWFGIVFAFSILGLVMVALRNDKDTPTYPHLLSMADMCAGLVAPAAAFTLLGKVGALAMLVVVIMTVVTSLASELVAVSAILTHDIYKLYLHPSTTDLELIQTSQWFIVAWGCITSAASCLAVYLDATCFWIFCLTGVVCSSTVPTLLFTICWKRQPRIAALLSPALGTVIGVVVWLSAAKGLHGSVSMFALADIYVALSGIAASFAAGLIATLVISGFWPDNFDFAITGSINMPVKEGSIRSETSGRMTPEYTNEDDPFGLNRASRQALWISVGISFFLIIAIPVPLFLTKYEFSVVSFRMWVVCAGLVLAASFVIVVIMPLVESRVALAEIIINVWRAVFGQPNGKDLLMHRTSTRSVGSSVHSSQARRSRVTIPKQEHRATIVSMNNSPEMGVTDPRWV